MATTSYPEVLATAAWDFDASAGAGEYSETLQANFSPYQTQVVRYGRYVNKAWDSSRGEWVRWTTDHIDFQGLEYPYSTWGSTSDYGVEKVIMENV
jgi:hypothetical protein